MFFPSLLLYQLRKFFIGSSIQYLREVITSFICAFNVSEQKIWLGIYCTNLCILIVWNVLQKKPAQSAEAAEYTDCISAERHDSLNECPRYDTKQSDGEVQ